MADSGEPGGQVALGGSWGVPNVEGLAGVGDPSLGVCGEPGEREAPSQGSTTDEGAPGAWMEVAKSSSVGG